MPCYPLHGTLRLDPGKSQTHDHRRFTTTHFGKTGRRAGLRQCGAFLHPCDHAAVPDGRAGAGECLQSSLWRITGLSAAGLCAVRSCRPAGGLAGRQMEHQGHDGGVLFWRGRGNLSDGICPHAVRNRHRPDSHGTVRVDLSSGGHKLCRPECGQSRKSAWLEWCLWYLRCCDGCGDRRRPDREFRLANGLFRSGRGLRDDRARLSVDDTTGAVESGRATRGGGSLRHRQARCDPGACDPRLQ